MKNQEIQKIAQSLEITIADRTAELDKANSRNERRARQFEAIAKISRVISQAQNLDIRVRINGQNSNAVLLPVQ